MEWIKKLGTETVVAMIVFYVGIKTMRDVLYNHYLKEDGYWRAFIHSPYRFIKYNGKQIKL